MNYSNLYGCQDRYLLQVKGELEQCLGILLEERESDYHGGLYYSHKFESGGRLMLKQNIDLYDDEPAEQKFPDFPALLYVSFSGGVDPVAQLLPSNLRLLRKA